MAKKNRTMNRLMNDSWIKPYLKQNKRLLLLVLFLGTATFVCAGALMFSSGYLISKASLQPENILLIYVPIVLVRAFGIFRPVFRYVERLTSHNLVLKILSSMRVRLYQKLEKQALVLKSRFSTGDLLGVLADDLEHIQNLYLRTIFPSIIAVILYVISVIALGVFSIPFALLMLLFLFVLVVLFPLVSLLITRKRHVEAKQARGNLYQTLADAVMGISDWKISGRQKDFIQSYEEKEKRQDLLEDKMEQFNRNRNFLFQVMVTIITLTMIWFASASAESGVFGHVWIAAFVLVVFPIIEAMAPIPDAVSQLPSYEHSLSRMNSIEDRANKSNHTDSEKVANLSEETKFMITFDDVSFSYDTGEPKRIVDRINLSIHSGERIAMLGKSGAGKSTLAKLLLGSLSPESGSITINAISVDELEGEIAQFISVLQQKPHLFDSTVMNNIRLGNPDASDEDIIEVAKQVQMHEYISSLPDGYQTRMKELGARFSGGERQRIALARILLQKTPIVILDEPTVGLDPLTERNLLNTIFQTLKGKTVIWITHHLVGVEMMDRVIFIEGGKVKMEGKHDVLLKTNPRYENLYRMDKPLYTEASN